MPSEPRPAVELTARCACGSVEIGVRGEVRAMLLCSCEDCQKASGTGHSAIAIFDAKDVAIAGPLRTFERPAASGATLTRSFCPTCGTPLAGRSSRWPDALLLPVGLFGAESGWFRPSQLIFARSHQEWDSVAEALPRFDTYRQRTEER